MKEMQALQSEQMSTAMAQMKEQFATMPPEQRKQMEALMAQSGVKIDDDGVSLNNDQLQISSSGSKVKSCITQAEIDRGGLPETVDGCTSTIQKVGASRYKATYVCTGEEQSTGESEVTFHSSKHYSGTGKMTTTLAGKPRVMTFKMEGTWLVSGYRNFIQQRGFGDISTTGSVNRFDNCLSARHLLHMRVSFLLKLLISKQKEILFKV
jgi:hypothetical protein